MTDSAPSSPLEALLRLPATIVAEFGAALPRLADRTRAQVDFAATVVEKLRCGDLGRRLSALGSSVPERLADVVPFEPRAAAADLAGAIANSTPVREVIEVVTVAAAARSGKSPIDQHVEAEIEALPKNAPAVTTSIKAPAAKRSVAKKAPAKKVVAKKAPAAKAPAKKVVAKKAPAKKAVAAKAPAAKAPAKKVVAKKAPAKKAVAKKAPAKKAVAAKAPAKKAVTTAAPAPVPDAPVVASALAIPGYDALAASQVMPRLESLTAVDLEQVRAYELAGRGRRTILSRIAQLQAG